MIQNYRRIEQRLRRRRSNDDDALEYSLRFQLQDKKKIIKCWEPESDGEIDSDQEYPSQYVTEKVPNTSMPSNHSNYTKENTFSASTSPISNLPNFQTRDWEADICFSDDEDDMDGKDGKDGKDNQEDINEDGDSDQDIFLNENARNTWQQQKIITTESTLKACSQLNTRLMSNVWENNVVWDEENVMKKRQQQQQHNALTGKRLVVPIRLSRDDSELILNRRTGGFHHTVDDVAKSMNHVISRAIHTKRNPLQQDRIPLQHWLGFRGSSSYQGCAPHSRNGVQDHINKRRKAELTRSGSSNKRNVVSNSKVALRHMALSSQHPLTYNTNGMSFHKPMLMTYSYDRPNKNDTRLNAKSNTKTPPKSHIWKFGYIKHKNIQFTKTKGDSTRRRQRDINNITDLSLQEESGTPIIVEYLEEHPPIALNVGMSMSIKRYCTKKKILKNDTNTTQSINMKPLQLGKQVILSKNGFHATSILSGIPISKNEVTVVENGLFCAPAKSIKLLNNTNSSTSSSTSSAASTSTTIDLLVSSSKEVVLKSQFPANAFKVGVVMKLPSTILVVGQLEPNRSVYKPLSKNAKDIYQKLLKIKIIKLLNKKTKNDRWMLETEIEKSFRTYNSNTKEAKYCLNKLYDEDDSVVENRKVKNSKQWRIKGDKKKR